MALALASPSETLVAGFRRKSRIAVAIPMIVLAYLIYAAIAFDLGGLMSRVRLDNAQALLSDFWSYKIHVTRVNRSGKTLVTIEGDARDAFSAANMPPWVKITGDVTVIDLGRGHLITYDPSGAHYDVPGYGTLFIAPQDGRLALTAPQPVPDWINVSDNRISVETSAGKFSYSRSKVETLRYFPGWEEFFFTLDSPFADKSLGELTSLALAEPRLDADHSNLAAMTDAVWHNRLWHHSDVVWAMGETVLLAFLGTFAGALIALPLAFFAASNMMPLRGVRFGMRRLFDFIRGTDALIWTLILVRAFGPGPMTGALAILMTDTGYFGKVFSEALENIDEKQVEGVRSTGASNVQRARFGVLPQIFPVLASQVLYNFESNTGSATVIGAIVGGGIGLIRRKLIKGR